MAVADIECPDGLPRICPICESVWPTYGSDWPWWRSQTCHECGTADPGSFRLEDRRRGIDVQWLNTVAHRFLKVRDGLPIPPDGEVWLALAGGIFPGTYHVRLDVADDPGHVVLHEVDGFPDDTKFVVGPALLGCAFTTRSAAEASVRAFMATKVDIPEDKPDPINAQPPADDGLADGGIRTSEKI